MMKNGIFTKIKHHGINQYYTDIPIYGTRLYVIFGQDDKVRKIPSFAEIMDCDVNGFVAEVSNGVLVWFRNNEYRMVANGTLSHELVHIVDDVSKYHSLHHSNKSEHNEHLAYLTGYLFKILLMLFKKK